MAASNERSDDTEGRRAAGWLTGAIVLAAIGTTVLSLIVWLWGFEADADHLERIQTLTPIALFLGAAVTFFTVVWRGLISSRQANYQQRQLDSLARQMASTEENNLAQLLQKGAELIEDETKPARIDAGLASLQAVAESDVKRFQEPARNLIVEFLRRHGYERHGGRGVQRAIAALADICQTSGVMADTSLFFVEDAEAAARYPDYETRWSPVLGVRRVIFEGGCFQDEQFDARLRTHEFNNVSFADCVFDSLANFELHNCWFRKCRFGEVTTSHLTSQRFRDCDFSGTSITGDTAPLPDLKEGGNWFEPANPPKLVGERPFHATEMLHAGRPEKLSPFD